MIPLHHDSDVVCVCEFVLLQFVSFLVNLDVTNLQLFRFTRFLLLYVFFCMFTSSTIFNIFYACVCFFFCNKFCFLSFKIKTLFICFVLITYLLCFTLAFQTYIFVLFLIKLSCVCVFFSRVSVFLWFISLQYFWFPMLHSHRPFLFRGKFLRSSYTRFLTLRLLTQFKMIKSIDIYS